MIKGVNFSRTFSGIEASKKGYICYMKRTKYNFFMDLAPYQSNGYCLCSFQFYHTDPTSLKTFDTQLLKTVQEVLIVSFLTQFFFQQGHSTFEETRMRRRMLAEKFHPLDKNNLNLNNPNLA